jgi:Fe-S oxidoreductase
MSTTFENALAERVETMLDACTRCGKCVEVCPVTAPGGVTEAPRAVIDGIIDILRLGEGPQGARKWADACVLSGECIKACDYGVNPRFLLSMARLTMCRRESALPDRRRRGVEAFRRVAREVTQMSRLQLDEELLRRLGQDPVADAEPSSPPDFVFYTGCNVLRTPHIALYALDIMDRLGASYRVMGGPNHCCGIAQMRAGDMETSARLAESTMGKLAQSKSGQVVSWCPSCHVQMTEIALPTVEKTRGARPFEMTPFLLCLRAHLDRLRPLLAARVEMRVALHRHPGIAGVVEAAEDILAAVPGVELVDLGQPAVGLMSNYFRALPAYRRRLQQSELEAAEKARVDALVAVYHADHRELCAHERDYRLSVPHHQPPGDRGRKHGLAACGRVQAAEEAAGRRGHRGRLPRACRKAWARSGRCAPGDPGDAGRAAASAARTLRTVMACPSPRR